MAVRNYCMIIGDIIDSKKIPDDDRYKIQENLKRALEKINFDYDTSVCSQFCITLGDELQGGLINTRHLFKIINRIKKSILPYKIRFGIGIGELSTAINFNLSLETDGPAYHEARKGIDELKKEKTYEYGYRIYSANNSDCILNSLLKVIDNISSSWTKSQKKYMDIVMDSDSDLKKIANYLNIATSTLSRTLSRANYKLIKEVFENIETYLFEEYDLSKKQMPCIALYNGACKYYDANQFAEAITALKSISFYNNIDKLNQFLLLSMCYTAIGERHKAIKCATEGLEYTTMGFIYRRVKFYNMIGINYTDLEEADYAEEAFNKAREIINNDPNPASVIWYNYTIGNIARLYKSQRKYGQAKKIYLEMLNTLEKVFPSDKLTYMQVLSNLGNIYIEEQKYKKAYEILQKALTLAEIYLAKDNKTFATIKLYMGEAIVGLCTDGQAEDLDIQEKAYIMLNAALKVFAMIKYEQAIIECYKTLINLCTITGDKINLRYYKELLAKKEEE